MSTETYVHGTFCWHELHSTDVKKSNEFYTELSGWTTVEMEMGDGNAYKIFKNGKNGIGGMMPHSAEISAKGSNWLAYVHVTDTDAAAVRAKNAGGKIIFPPSDIPNVGRFAILEDLEGVRLAAITLSDTNKMEDEKFGYFCWNEFMSNDMEKAQRFYSEVFGWTVKDGAVDEAGPYSLWMAGESQVGGFMKVSADCGDHPACWTSYILVEDIEKESKRVGELGGKVVAGPELIPGVGHYTIFKDITGATSALYQMLDK
jgi:uncharacterized protein